MSAKPSRLLAVGVALAGLTGASLTLVAQDNPRPKPPAAAEPETHVPAQGEFPSELDLHEMTPVPEIELPPMPAPAPEEAPPAPPQVEAETPPSGPPPNVKKVETVPSKMPVVNPEATDPGMVHQPKPHPRSDMPIVEIEVPEGNAPEVDTEVEGERPEMPMNP